MVCKVLKVPPDQVSEFHITYLLSCQDTEPGLFLQQIPWHCFSLRSKVVLKTVLYVCHLWPGCITSRSTWIWANDWHKFHLQPRLQLCLRVISCQSSRFSWFRSHQAQSAVHSQREQRTKSAFTHNILFCVSSATVNLVEKEKVQQPPGLSLIS